jgi:hypothetical protein
MPATADAQGRIKCKACGNTLLILEDGLVRWDIHVRGGGKRRIGIPADSPALNDLLVLCDRCGARWTPTPLGKTSGLEPAPVVSGVLKPVAA